MSDTSNPTIEVWLRLDPRGGVTCEIVGNDESSYRIDLEAHSVEGARPEITASLVSAGHRPVGDWRATAWDSQETTIESVRVFAPV